jgi:hypothetical protein
MRCRTGTRVGVVTVTEDIDRVSAGELCSPQPLSNDSDLAAIAPGESSQGLAASTRPAQTALQQTSFSASAGSCQLHAGSHADESSEDWSGSPGDQTSFQHPNLCAGDPSAQLAGSELLWHLDHEQPPTLSSTATSRTPEGCEGNPARRRQAR